MTITGLAEMIHDHTGETGAELEALTFYVAAGLGSVFGQKEASDHFHRRCREATKRSRWAEAQKQWDENR